MFGKILNYEVGSVISFEYEKTNGLIYTAGTEVEFSKDYNRNISVKLGLGYRF